MGSKEPKIPTTRNHKNHPIRKGEEERKTKVERKRKKRQRAAKESTGTKKGEKKRKRVDPGRPREEGKMKAWLGKSCTWYG